MNIGRIRFRAGKTVALAVTAAFVATAAVVVGASSAQAATPRLNDTDASVAYSAGWTHSTGLAGYVDYDGHYSGTTGATTTESFTGTTVSWIGSRNSDHGKADVVVCDGAGNNCGTVTTLDTYAAIAQPQQTLYTASGLANAAHTLKITVRSDANAASSGHFTDVDAFLVGTPAAALTGTYYVDNSPTSNCSDTAAGTATSAPWCDFANLNGQTFGPGAQILLKRGDTFGGELGKLFGSGTSAAPIVLGAYGTGARPHIAGASQVYNRAVWIEDGSYWTVQDLEISNVGAGLVFWYNTNGHTGITVDDVYTHDVVGVFAGEPKQADLPGMYHSVGVLITGDVPVTASDSAVSNVTFSNLEGYNDNDDVDISGFNANSGGQQGFLSTDLGHHSVSDVRLVDSYFHHALSGENFDNLQNMTITGMRLDDTGHGANIAHGTTALFFWSSSTVTVSNSILNGEVNTGSPDQTETDLEAYDDHIRFLGDFFGNSAGNPLEILELNGVPNNYQSDHEIGDSVFTSFGGGSAIRESAGSNPTNVSGSAHDNLYAASGSVFSDGLTAWTHSTANAGYLNTDAHYTGQAGATATAAFTGTTASWIGGRNNDHGKADVVVCDGAGANCGTVTTVDTYASSAQTQQTLYTASGLAAGAHTLKITVRSDANAASNGHYTDVDAIVSGTSSGTTKVNDTDASLAYSTPWTLTNNTAAAAASVYNAGFTFSSTQGTSDWHNQYFTTGGGWLDITSYDGTNQRWGTNGYVSRFDLLPDTCSTCAVARDWVAPTAGSIAIRGRVLKNALGGDGITARITKNGTQIWPATGGAHSIAGTDTSGVDTNVNVTVGVGDSIRFEVADGGAGNATSDLTAWAPSIAYQ